MTNLVILALQLLSTNAPAAVQLTYHVPLAGPMQVQTSDSPAGPWTKLATVTTAAGTNSVALFIPPGNRRFFRLRQ